MNTVSGRRRGDMEAIGDLRGMIEMLVQGVDVLEDAAATADDEVVDGDDMLGVFGEGYAADVLGTPSVSGQQAYLRFKPRSNSILDRVVGHGAYRMQRNLELCRHQHNSHDLIQPAKTTSIHLDIIQRLSLQELLEHDAILTVLAGGDLDIVFSEGGADGLVTKDVIGRGGFFDEERFEGSEFLYI